MTKVSVVVPVYNVEDYIAQCLDSLVNQDIDDYEIICVNDGSPDGSRVIIEEYKKKYPRIKLIDQENQGLSCARNTGMRYASGEYLMFVDSDDFLEPNVLNGLYEKSRRDGLDILDFLAYSFRSGQRKPWMPSYIKSDKVLDGKTYFVEFTNKIGKQPFVSAWVHLFRRDFLIDNGLTFIPNRYYEDSPFTAVAYLKANRVSLVETFVYNYRVADNSITKGRTKPKHITDYAFIIDEIGLISKNNNVKIPMDIFIVGLKNQISNSYFNGNWTENKPYFNTKIFSQDNFHLASASNRFIYSISSFCYSFFVFYAITHGWLRRIFR